MALHRKTISRLLTGLIIVAVVGVLLLNKGSYQFLKGSLLSDRDIAVKLKTLADTDASGELSPVEIRRSLLSIIRGVILQNPQFDIDEDGAPDRKDIRATVKGFRDLMQAVCGNGVREGAESCDDGNQNNDDTCTNQCTENSLVSSNRKDMAKYQDKKVFTVSDKNYRDVLSLLSATIWTGNEACQAGYLTPDGVCVYPLLIMHEKEALTKIPLKDELVDSRSITFYNGGGQIHLNKVNHKDALPCSLQNPYLWERDFRYVEDFAQVGDTVQIEIDLQNCGTEAVQIDQLRYVPHCDGVRCTDHFREINKQYNSPITIAPQETKTITFEIVFYQGFAAGNDFMSSVFFLQDFQPSEIVAVGGLSQLFREQFEAAGINPNIVHDLAATDIPSFWQSYEDVVYVEDDYETALVAATYASLINAPLVIENSPLDRDEVIGNKNVICVGNIGPKVNQCDDANSISELQGKFIARTDTDKMVITNPRDLDEYVLSEYYSQNFISGEQGFYNWDIFGKNSLSAAILASAKHEALFPVRTSDVDEVNAFIKGKVNLFTNLKFLTIFGGPELIPMTFPDFNLAAGLHRATFLSADFEKYAQLDNSNKALELATGRMFGLSSNDASAFVARSLFYSDMLGGRDKKMTFLTSGTSIAKDVVYMNGLKDIFAKMGYETTYTDADSTQDMRPFAENTALALYMGHGGPTGLVGMNSPPRSHGMFHMGYACDSCAYDLAEFGKGGVYCFQVPRMGAIGYVSEVNPASAFDFFSFLGQVYSDEGSTIGEAMATAKSGYLTGAGTTHLLVGDPTLRLQTPYTLPKPKLELVGESNGIYEYDIEIPVLIGETTQESLGGQTYHTLKTVFSTFFGLQPDVNYGKFNFECLPYEIENIADEYDTNPTGPLQAYPLRIWKDNFLGKCNMWIEGLFFNEIDMDNLSSQAATVRKKIFITPAQ